MRRRAAPWMVALAMVLVPGCGPAGPGGGGSGGVVVLAKAEGWRDGLQEAAGHPFVLIEVAADPAGAERAWDDNVPGSLVEADGEPAEPGVYHALDSVDLDEQAVVVYSSGESGTCPAWVDELSTTDGRVEVHLRTTAEQGDACTDDFRPYRLVLAVDRDRLPPAGDLPVDRVDLPSENLSDVEGRVVAYPGR